MKQQARLNIMISQGRQLARPIAFYDIWTNATPSEAITIPDMLRGLEAIVVAVIAREGNLLDANRGFLLLMTGTASVPERADVRSLFVNPPFDAIVARRTDPFDGTTYRGLVSLGRPGGKITSLPSAIYPHDHDYLFVAEHDIARLETLRTTILELQDDLALKQRQIVNLENRIAQLQDLADAALRDRDALLNALAKDA